MFVIGRKYVIKKECFGSLKDEGLSDEMLNAVYTYVGTNAGCYGFDTGKFMDNRNYTTHTLGDLLEERTGFNFRESYTDFKPSVLEPMRECVVFEF